MSTIHIAISSNQTYYFGLCATIASIRANCDKTHHYKFWILDGGINDTDWDLLNQFATPSGAESTLIRTPISQDAFAAYPSDWGTSKMAYARLLLPELAETDRIIYVDSDTICEGDISAIWDIDLEGKTVAACIDPTTPTLGDENLPLEALGLQPELPYMQSGFMLIDLAKWKQQKVSEKAFGYLEKHPNNARFWDQSALNAVLVGEWKKLDASWNYPAPWFDEKGIPLAEISLLHFIGPSKPWQALHKNNKSSLIFYKYIDQSHLKNWRPSLVRHYLKTAKYQLTRLLKNGS